jgi:PAS domain S-box-containing protein
MIRKYTKKVGLFLICFQFCLTILSFGQSIDKKKALWVIQNFAPNANWTDEANISSFTIGVFGNSTQIYEELVNLSVTKKLKGKYFTVKRFRKVKDITATHVLFVENNENNNLREIYQDLKFNTLLITDQSRKSEYTMIDLFDLEKDKKKYEINKSNAADFGISFDKAILLHGGGEADLKELYTNTAKELQEEKQKLELQRRELVRQTEELSKLKKSNLRERQENERQRKLNDQQKDEINKQQAEIDAQREKLSRVQENISVQAEEINRNERILETQEDKIKSYQDTVQARREAIELQLAEIEKNQLEMETKDTTLLEQGFLIRFQRIVLFIFIGLLVVIFILAFYIYRGYLIKQKINEELRIKNIAINKQKEEILNQHRQTDLLNKELERLSIVASKTENAVTIMDAEGNFEWVNVGFTRLYGYTLQLLTHEVDENILGVSSNPDIKEIVDVCLTTKKTQVYESVNKTRSGGSIWVQTSLTPILDPEGNVSKLITIETDITKIKKAETEIREQHAKILEQTHQLEATNKELEKLSLVASETENAISIMDAAGNYQWLNAGFSRLYGYTYNQLISEYSRNIITEKTDTATKELIKESIEKKTPVTYDRLEKNREGKDIWVQTTITPIKDTDGNLKNLISIASNISKLKEAEQAIRQQSEELMAQKEELILIKERIELQNQNIQASISYAKTIQTAILPPDNDMNKQYETFVIYKPKDIVSGDFYWHSCLEAKNGGNNIAFYAAVDCTGHGVPGAFMSMIGSSLLNEIVNEKKITQPSKILDIMNTEIKAILRQEQTDNDDGMDVCLCSLEHIHNGTVKMTFAGAKRPLYYYKNNESSLKYIKGTRKTIGGTKARRNREVFVDHEVLLEKGDLLYLSTDGIVDQPSPDRVRFGSIRFINLLKQIGSYPLTIQREVVEQAIFEYQDYEQQRDDVTFIGVKV